MPSSSNSETHEAFTAAWDALAGRRGWGSGARAWLAELLAHYNEPQRHYHHAGHVTDLLARMKEVRFQDVDAAQAAAFFHDAIYKVGASDNEARSADLARKALSELDDSGFAETVAAICAATATHEATGNPDADLFLDIDMAVLGDPPEAYRRYRDAVMREYTTVFQRESYLIGRISLFVEPTLERERIFLTEAFAPRETQARENLAAEREWLRGGAP